MSKEPPKFPSELSQKIKWPGPIKEKIDVLEDPNPDWGLLFGVTDLSDDQKKKIKKAIKTSVRLADNRVKNERDYKLALLSRHYGISEQKNGEDWIFDLCMRICTDFIEGFKVDYSSKTGRPLKWGPREFALLILRVQKIKLENNWNNSRAIRHLLKREDIKKPSEKEINSRSARYYEGIQFFSPGGNNLSDEPLFSNLAQKILDLKESKDVQEIDLYIKSFE